MKTVEGERLLVPSSDDWCLIKPASWLVPGKLTEKTWIAGRPSREAIR